MIHQDIQYLYYILQILFEAVSIIIIIMSHTLAYGDVIRIYCSLQDNTDGTNKVGGFLMSKGFADTNIYFLKSDTFTQFQLRNSLFQILPYSSFQIHDEAKKKKESDEKRKKQEEKRKEEESRKKEYSPSKKEGEGNKEEGKFKSKQEGKPKDQKKYDGDGGNVNSKSSKQTELEQFKSKIAKQKKMQISFDSEVVIKHVNSDTYLQGQFSCPETGIGSFKVILSEQLSSDVKFKITRFRNSDKESEKIQSKDEFSLYHCTSHCYLNIGNLDQKVFLDKPITFKNADNYYQSPLQLAKKDNEAYKFVNQRPLIKQPNQGGEKTIYRHEIVNMSKPTLILKFLLEKSSRQQTTESQIQHNDVVYIRNTQNMSYLTADLWSGDVKLVSYFGQRSGDFPYEGIWEVSVPRDSEKGQFDNNGKKYFLKHYITDRICKVEKVGLQSNQDIMSNHQQKTHKSDKNHRNQRYEKAESRLKRLKLHSKIPISTSKPMYNDNRSPLTEVDGIDTFKIVAYDEKKVLSHRDLIFLQVCKSRDDSNISRDQPNPRSYYYETKVPEYLDIGNRTEKNYRTELEEECAKNTANYSLELTTGPLINAFQIFKFEEKKLKQINTLLSCVQILTNFCDVLIVFDHIYREEIKNKKRDKSMSYEELRHIKHRNSAEQSLLFDGSYSGHRHSRVSQSNMRNSEQPPKSNLEIFLNQYLNYYILNLVIRTIEYLSNNITKKNKKPDFAFMMMIRSLGLIQILIQATFFIERSNQIDQASASNFKNKKYRKHRLDECFKQIYLLFLKLSGENSCKLHLGKWFGMFVSQFYHLKKDFIHSLIIALLKQKIIIDTLKQSDIDICINEMRQNLGEKDNYQYLELLSSFCRTKDQAITLNQQKIILNLSQHPDIFYKFSQNKQFNAQNQSWKKQLCYSRQKQGELQSIYNKKQQKQNYIIFLLNLYAELIFDRPQDKIQKIQKFITMNTVKIFFLKKDAEENEFKIGVIDSFLKLTHQFFKSKLSTKTTRIKLIDKQKTLYKAIQRAQNTQLRRQYEIEERFFQDFTKIIEYIKQQVLQKQKNQTIYKIQALKTIQTSLDFIRTVARVKNDYTMDQILKLIISQVIKLKVDYIYKGAQSMIKDLHTNYNQIQDQSQQEQKKQNEKEHEKKKKIPKSQLIESIDSVINSNIQKLLSQKKMERLAIDTRSIAGEILDIKINLLMNQALEEMNYFFIKVCNNQANIQRYSKPLNGDTFVFGKNNEWIWINKIISIVDEVINGKLNQLIIMQNQNNQHFNFQNQDQNQNSYEQIEAVKNKGKTILVKLLIECIFVDSLKIVNRIVLLIFKLYELRKTLLYRFKDTFIIMQQKFAKISEFNILWISDFQKAKPQDFKTKNILIKRLQILSYILRFYESEEKMDDIKNNYLNKILNIHSSNKEEDLIEQTLNYQKLKEGSSSYIVIDETQTNLSINQILLQKMIGNQKIHTHVLSYVDTLQEDNKNYDYDEHLSIVYQFLTLLVYNNTKNKKILTKNIMTVLKHITTNYKAIEFMKKLIIENQNILNNRDLVSTIVKSILEGAHSVSGDPDKLIIKAKLIQSLRVFCILEGKSHVENQSLIMIRLQNKQYENTLMFSSIEYKSNKNIRKQEGNEGIVNIVAEMFTIGADQCFVGPFMCRQPDYFEQQIKDINLNINNFKKYPSLFEDFGLFRDQYNDFTNRQQNDEGFMVDKQEEIDVPPTIMALSAYFSTMCALVEGNHEVNKGKCCNMHPYESLVELVKDGSKCWPFIRHVRAYIIKLYFSDMNEKIERKTGTVNSAPGSATTTTLPHKQALKHFEVLLSKLFQKEIDILFERVRAVNQDLLDANSKIYRLKISTPIRYQYMGAYLFCSLQQILYQVNLFFKRLEDCMAFSPDIKKKRPLTKQESDKLKNLICSIGQTYQLMSNVKQKNSLQKILDSILNCSFIIVELINISEDSYYEYLDIPEYTAQINLMFQTSPVLSTQQKQNRKKLHIKYIVYFFFLSNEVWRQNMMSSPNSNQLPDLNIKNSPQSNIKKSYVRSLIPSSVEKLPIKDSQNQNQPNVYLKRGDQIYKQLESQPKEIRINRLLEIISEDLVDRKQSQDIIQKEMDDLVELCCNLDEIDPDNIQDPKEYRVVGYKKFMSNIIQLITKSPPHLTLEGKIKTITLIRLIFEQKVNRACGITENKEREWDSSMFQNTNLVALEKIQTQFKDLNLNVMIVAILKSEVQSYQLLSETFKLGIRFLYNGNNQCQQAILKNLQQDSQNMVMVQLFNFIKKIRFEISQGKFIIKKKDQNTSENKDFSELMIDTFHHFDLKDKIMCQLGAQKDNSKEFEQQILIKIQCVCEAYQFLQLMCQNDNQKCKNFLREQKNLNKITKYNSINFVSQTAKLFKVVLDNFNSQSKHYKILQYLADFFIEVTQLPCTKNQRQLCSTSIFLDIKYEIVKKEKYERFEGSDKPVCYLMDFVVNAGLSLLEGGEEIIYESLIATLDGQFIYEIFKYQAQVLNVLSQKHPQCPQIYEFTDDTLKILLTTQSQYADIRKRIHMVYNLFALVEKLSKHVTEMTHQSSTPVLTPFQKLQKYVELVEKSNSDNTPKAELHSEIIKRFPEKLKHIEVVFEGRKQYLYFPNLPIFKQLSEETQLQVVENIKRDTQIDKITDFLVKSSQINHLMDWNFKVEDRLSLKTQTLDLIRLNILILTSVIVSLYIIFTSIVFVEVKGKIQMLKTIDNPIIHGIVNILCVFHLFFSVYFVFTWCTLKYRMLVQRQLKQKQDQDVKRLLAKIDNDDSFDYKDFTLCVSLMLKQSEISILFFFIFFSFMGYFVGLEWYSMLIFDIVTREKILKNVIQAITFNLRQLLVVSLLILAFVYVFNMISIEFNLYLPLIYENEDEKCTVLRDCVISLYTSGEIGQKHKDFKFTKFIADLLYIVIMQLLFSNIVSGIVIDTFAQLRNERKTIQSDNKTKCFICGISKGTLQKQLRQEEDSSLKHQTKLKKFEDHTTKVHNQWDYIYYLYILSKKDITTYTGIEYFIKRQCFDDQYDWIPIYEEDDDKEIKEILETTKKLIPKIKERLQNKIEYEN